MNRQVLLLRGIIENNNITQRGLVKTTGLALGSVNKLVRKSIEEGLIEAGEKLAQHRSDSYRLTEKGMGFMKPYRVDAAVIMAAGFGSRFVPLSFETPKGLLKVFDEPMVERQIKQLHEAGISDITVIVGYMKEKFEYLTDKYGCRLIYNPDFETKNNISSIYYARQALKGKNAYILSSDNWIRENMYHGFEGGAWYSAVHFEGETSEWVLVTDKKGRITDTYPGGRDCNCMMGPAYFSRDFSDSFLPVLERYYKMPGSSDYYWENVLMDMLNGTAYKRLNAFYGRIPELELCSKLEMSINLQPKDNVYEFENLEELRLFDKKYVNDSGSEAMQLVSRVLKVPESEIQNIRRLKAGMTNNSWLFTVNGESYICRIPGKGTEKLINRHEEYEVYKAVSGLDITEHIVYHDETNGYKISEYYEGSRNADPKNDTDMRYCMKKLRTLHDSGLKVGHSFNIGAKIEFYEELCGGADSIPFSDYSEMSALKNKLLSWLEHLHRPEVLSHIDSVADNFLFLKGADISENERDISRIKLIDWEYAAMNDPLIDIGMCAIYSYMDESGAEKLMKAYFEREPEELERNIVYAYMALGGLLWALWGVYKEQLGVNFTDYTIKMYRYFKKYARKVTTFADL